LRKGEEEINLKKRLVSIPLIAIFLISMMPIIIGPTAASPLEVEAMRSSPEQRKANYDIVVEESIEPRGHHSYWEVGDIANWLIRDDYYGVYRVRTFQLMKIGTTAELWVQTNLGWPVPDPYDPDRPYPTILQTQIDYLLAEFENHIWPTDTGYFGMNDFHAGTNAVLDDLLGLPPDYYEDTTGRNVILISNIRDANYYTTYPYYVAGFYSPTMEYYFDRNIINIDCYQWERRLGPEGTEWIPGVFVDRPYSYEGVTAHEWQHLIHDDYNTDDPSWMNEACSMFAEILCGYGADWSSINSYLYTPDNSLTIWGDQGDINILADYGQAQLWAVYLNDHYGSEFLGYFVQAGIPDVGGVEAALDHFGFRDNFIDVFHDFRVANLIHTDFPGCGKYNYKTIDLADGDPIFTHVISGLPVPWTKGTDFGNTITILDYDTGISLLGGYGSDYIVLNNWKVPGLITFDGDDKAQELVKWTLTDYGWYSGEADLLNALLLGSAHVDPANPVLEMTTYWDMEDYWDFGFIQISTDGGQTWASLANEYTTFDHDPNAHPDIVANLPGLTSWSGFIDPDGWITMSFDLSAYAGQTVLVGFRYMTDWATTYEGWYISEATVSGTPIDLAPFAPDWEADFMVTAVYAFVICGHTIYMPVDMWLCDKTEFGMTFGAKKPSYTVLIVSSKSEQGWVDYKFKASGLSMHGCGKLLAHDG
jgi:hypothetical protein